MKQLLIVGLIGSLCVIGYGGANPTHPATQAKQKSSKAPAKTAPLALNDGYIPLADAELTLTRTNAWKVRQLQLNLSQEISVSKAFIASHIGFVEGDEIDETAFQVASKQLYDTGWIDTLRWEVKKVDANTLDLRLSLVIFPKIAEFRFEGNNDFTGKTLEYEMKSRINEACNPHGLQADVARLKAFYTSKGYFKSDVSITHEPLRDGYETVIVTVNEDLGYKIKRIDFQGVTAFKPGKLRDLLVTRKWWPFSFFTKTGRLDEDRLQHDIDTLRNHYRNAGYLDVEINRKNVAIQNKGNRLRIVFKIQEGERYYIGNVSVTSDVPEDEEKLTTYLGFLKKGAPASAELIEQGCEFLRDYYGKDGYVDARVDVKRTFIDHEVDLAFSVVRGAQYRVHSIYLTGNVHSQSRLVVREMNLAPGDLLNRRRMKLAELRLQNTGLFKSAVIVPEDSSMPYEKDVKVVVEEDKTGSISLTGGISSTEKITVGLTLGQSNFDWGNGKDYHRGAGQKAQTGITVGKYSQQIGFNFEEPWLFDRELRWGFGLTGSRSNLNQKDYKQQRVGADIYVGKRLFELVEGRLYYHIEHFKLVGVDDSVSQAVKDEEGSRVISKIGFELSRDTRDQFVHPTEGNVAVWDNQFAGVGGKTKYVRSKAVFAQWFLVTPNYEQVLMLKCKGAAVRGWGGKDVPLFEREYLGGESDLRGFDYQEAGPRSNDFHQDPLGGKYAIAGISEYSIALHPRFRLIFYLDAGKVVKMNDKYLCPGTDTIYADAGIGTAIDILNVPLKLFFSYPFKAHESDSKEFPHFSYAFGVTF
ncbi:MAG: outer membrane protein assembly factor BamA [Opitutales bacterium]|nr:outer membrane protein assembly factor BamA [Opitutales bacterium]